MNLPLTRNKKFHQGIFTPKYQSKFEGTSCIYRSGLELKFFRFCDTNPNVVKWSSEKVIIPYISPVDNRVHKYYVDNYVVIKEGQKLTKYLVEIKPHKQTQAPATKYKKKKNLLYEQQMWLVNNAKWDSARAYCKKHNLQFIIITDKDLN